MTKKYLKLLQISKKISKTAKPKHKRKIIKTRSPPINQDSFSEVSMEEVKMETYSDSINENEENDNINDNTNDNTDDLSKNVLTINPNTHLIVLGEGEHLLICSNYLLKMIGGSATCLGWLIDPNSKEFEIQSKGKALIPIEVIDTCTINQDMINSVANLIKSDHKNEDQTQLQENIKEFFSNRWDSAIILVKTEHALNLANIKIIKGADNYYEGGPNAIIYPSNINAEIDRYIIQNLSLSDLKKKILIVGDKNSGKSMLSVYLLNHILYNLQKSLPKSAVFYLESDLGQNSFFFPGTVGLSSFVSPVLSNLAQPVLLQPLTYDFIGEFSPQQFTTSYLKAIENCMNFYDYSSFNCPLIVNTHGYISNIGENILYDLVRIVKPDVVVILDKHFNKANNSDYGYLAYNPIAKIEEQLRKRTFVDHVSILGLPKVEQRGPAVWKLELSKFKEAVTHKKERKDATMLTYLLSGKNFEKNSVSGITRISELSLAQPVELSFDDFIFGVFGNNKTVFFFREHFTKFSMIFISSVVALKYSPALNTREKTYHQPLDYQHALTNSSCKGFGYIRDINPEKRTISIITPVASSQLGIINLIIKSSQVQFSNEIYLEDSALNVENWINLPTYNNESQPSKVAKPFINDILYGIGSESYRNLKSLRKIQ